MYSVSFNLFFNKDRMTGYVPDKYIPRRIDPKITNKNKEEEIKIKDPITPRIINP